MSTNLLRNTLLSLGILAVLSIGLLAYGRYQAVCEKGEAAATCLTPSTSSEMPWEAMARQLVSAVAF